MGLSSPLLPSLALPLRPQQPAAMLMLRWAVLAMADGVPRSISHWLCVRSVRPSAAVAAIVTATGPEAAAPPDPAAPPGWEERVRNTWLRLRRKSPPAAPRPKLPLRRTMRVLADLAGRDRWLYSSWARWLA